MNRGLGNVMNKITLSNLRVATNEIILSINQEPMAMKILSSFVKEQGYLSVHL